MLTFWNCLLIAAGIFVAILLISNIFWWVEEGTPKWVQQILFAMFWIFALSIDIYVLGLLFGFVKR